MANAQLEQLAARAAFADKAEREQLDRKDDDFHDLLNAVLWLLEAEGVALPDPEDPATARAAWL